MAKQTFTTGQVLTAAQMTSLQQTAMLGGAASAKVASYVLVAADAGTAISMDNGSATTITVNTGLFAAGDIVTILNLGAGVCTITAGTATVTTSGSLALAQNQGGVLRFTSASAAIFFQFATPASGDIEGVTAGTGISGGGTSGTVTITNSMATEITASGDIIVGTGSGTFDNLPIGSTGQVLTADTTVSPYKVKWETPGGALTVASIASGTLSGSSVTVSTLTAYDDILILIKGITMNGNDSVCLQINANATAPNYKTWQAYEIQATNYPTNYSQDTDKFKTNDQVKQSGGNNTFIWHLTNCKAAGLTMMEQLYSYEKSTSVYVTQWGKGIFDVAAAVSSIKILTDAGQSFTAGTYNIYGG